MPIGPSDAVQVAKNYVAAVIGPTAQAMRVEEIELDDPGRYWLVTLSFQYGEVNAATRLQEMIGREAPVGPNRDYKIFEIDRSNGEVASMKIRKM